MPEFMGDAEQLALLRGGGVDEDPSFAALGFRHQSRFETRQPLAADLDNVDRLSDRYDWRRTIWQGELLLNGGGEPLVCVLQFIPLRK